MGGTLARTRLERNPLVQDRPTVLDVNFNDLFADLREDARRVCEKSADLRRQSRKTRIRASRAVEEAAALRAELKR